MQRIDRTKIQEVPILPVCFETPEWEKISESRKEEIINGLYRKVEIIHSNAESHLATKVIDFLKRCG